MPTDSLALSAQVRHRSSYYPDDRETEALKIDEWNQMIDVNIRGVLHGIAAALPVMKKQGSGQVINVSSIGGHQVWPTCAVYSATKYAVIAISDGLRQENTDIRVTVISPGVTTSELAHTISHEETAGFIDRFREVAIPADAIAKAIGFAIHSAIGLVDRVLQRCGVGVGCIPA